MKKTAKKVLTGAAVAAGVAAAGAAMAHKPTRKKIVTGAKKVISEVQKRAQEVQKRAEKIGREAEQQAAKTSKQVKQVTAPKANGQTKRSASPSASASK
jgi:hypothetical protein